MRGAASAEGAGAKDAAAPDSSYSMEPAIAWFIPRTPNASWKPRAISALARLRWKEILGVEGGRGYVRMIARSTDGAPVVEYWRIEGAGHAWSGGRHEGSFADPKGPNASAGDGRFFLARASAANCADV